MSPWEVKFSNSKRRHYFFNVDTKESRWDRPAEVSEEDVRKLPGAEENLPVRASHLLVKHNQSRNPKSWREDPITRSKQEAIALLNQYNVTINGSPDTFAKLASQYSDCSSHSHSGDLGWFERGAMQAPFEAGARALQVGQISGVVDTDSGVHLILRTG